MKKAFKIIGKVLLVIILAQNEGVILNETIFFSEGRGVGVYHVR